MSSLQSQFITYNTSSIAQIDQELVSKKFVHLSVSDNTTKKAAYSPLNQLKINNAIDTAFGNNVYTEKVKKIIGGYLDYSYCGSAYSRFKALMKECNAIINKSNKKKSPDANVAIILQTIFDKEEFFNNKTILPQLKQLAKNHYIVLKLIGFPGDTPGNSINKVAKEVTGRSITALIIRAHGTPNSLKLGANNFYTENDISESDFRSLDPRATIIFSSCLTGRSLAKKIATVTQTRPVVA